VIKTNKFISHKLGVNIITLFPNLFAPFLNWSMIKKAQESGALGLKVHDLRQWAIDKRGTVDDRPYSGGPGMIIRIEPIYEALKKLRSKKSLVVLTDPRGKVFDQKLARKLSREKEIIIICGHYEGIDERVRENLIDLEISVGDYVLSGGELPAMIVTDAVSRLLPGVLAKADATEIETFSPGLKKLVRTTGKKNPSANQLLEFPQYARPSEFMGWKVPSVLLSGDHKKIATWQTKYIKVKK